LTRRNERAKIYVAQTTAERLGNIFYIVEALILNKQTEAAKFCLMRVDEQRND
jgi:hypothetical protein